MRWPSLVILALLVAMGIAVFTRPWQPRVRLVVASRQEADTGEYLAMELRSPDVVVFDHIRQFEVKVGGRWEAPDEPGCCYHTFKPPGSQRLFVARVPHAATTVRIACDCYRVHPLHRLALIASWRWPGLGERILPPLVSHLPRRHVWHPVVAEVELRATARTSAHNETLHRTGSSRFSLVSMGTPLAAAPGR
jgi:hypothetical protein